MRKIYLFLLAVLAIASTAVAQTPSTYLFSGSTGTYTSITGAPGTVVVPAASFSSADDASIGNLPIGFTFSFNSINQTVFAASTNGLIILGQTTNGTGLSSNALASTANTIAPLWEDNNITGGSVEYLTTGTAPNRVLTVQYNNLHIGGTGSSSNPTANFQIQLFETTNVIVFVYGSTSAAFTSTTASIGISGNSGNFLSVTPTSPTTPFATTSNASENTTISSATNFPTGTTYTFTAPPPCTPPAAQPTALNLTPTASTIAGSFTDAAPVPTGYLVVRTATNVQPVPVDGTVYSVGTNAIGYIESASTATTFTSTGLTPSTTYYYWVFSYSNTLCFGGPLYLTTGVLTNSATTTACSMSGVVPVGPGETYTTLKAAVDALLLNGVAGPVIIELNAAYTGTTDAVFPIVLGAVPCASAVNNITIRPAAGAGAKSITNSGATPTFDINGGNYWIIDGQQGGTGGVKDLTIANSSTTGTAIRFINEGSNNIVRYCIMTGVNTSTTSGVVVFSTTTGANGNDNNTIDNSTIRDGATTPANGIYSSGTTAAAQNNSGNTISNNTISNFFISTTVGTGILIVGGNTDWTITGNSIYQSTSRAFTAATSGFIGISISNTSGNNFLVNNNFIGGSAASASGSAWTQTGAFTHTFIGIRMSVGSTTASNVQGNTIKNIAITTSSTSTINAAIAAVTGSMNVGNITPNVIGDQSTTGNISWTGAGTGAQLTGILAGTGTPGVINISNNTIGGIAVTGAGTTILRGINLQGTATSYTVAGNTIGSTATANSLSNSTNNTLAGILSSSGSTAVSITGNTVANLTTTGTSTANQLLGISTSSGVNTVTGNTVRNLSSTSASTGTGTTASVIGISHTSTTAGNANLSQNTVFSLANTTPTAVVAVTGIHYAGPTAGTSVVARNQVYGLTLSTTSPTADIRGINFASGLASIQNNMIAVGAGVANGNVVHGLYEVVSTAGSSVYFNSVYIGGSGVGTQTGNSYAFRSDQTINVRTFQNNIFMNARSNASTGGKHYAVRVAGTAANPAGLTLNYNDYFVSGTGGVFGFFNAADVATLAAWQTAVGQDGNSLNIDPLYIAPTAATPDLHITSGTTTLESGALAVAGIAIDYDGNTRPGTPSGTNSGVGPDIGADEFDGLNPNLCSGTPAQGGTATASTAITCGGSNVTFTLNAPFTTGPGISFQWQTSPAGAGTWTDVPGATTTVAAFPITGNTDVRCLVKCIPSGLNTPSTTVTVNGVNCTFDVVKSANAYSSIAGTGTSVTGWRNTNSTDDNMSNAQPIGFTFNYKGQAFTQFLVSTNGFLTFNVGTAATGGAFSGPYSFNNSQLSTSLGSVNTLAPFYEDQVCAGNPGTLAGLNAAIKYQVDGVAPNRVLTVEWIGMETFNNAGPNLNYQVKLYETTGVVEYVYGTMEMFNGTANFTYSYTIGLNGPVVSAVPTAVELQSQQIANVQNFAPVASNSLAKFVDCGSKYVFTPGNYSGAAGTPAITNDEAASPTIVGVNAGPCTSLCGTYYSTLGATASAGITVCSAVTPGTSDDDVWFQFVATTSAQTITVKAAGGYDAVVQLFSDAGITSINCVNATGAGLTETIAATGLTPTNTYWVRVYHAGTGNGTTSDISICVNEVVPPPANDDPCGAQPLTVSTTCVPYVDNTSPSRTSFVSATTTTSNGVVTPTCSGAGATVNDVWFSFVAPAGGTANITVTPVAGVNPAVQLYSVTSGTCAGLDLVLAPLGCVNGSGTGVAEQTVANSLTVGNTYYVRVYQHPSGTGGTPVANSQFNICVFTPLPTCPATFTPANAATACPSTSATTLSWTAGADATGYDVYFDAGAGPATTLVSPNQAGLTYNAGVLAAGQYSWRVEARNAVGTTVCSNLTFTIIASNVTTITPAGPITICAPATQTLTLGATTATSPTFQWVNGNANISGETNNNYVVTASGTYRLVVTDGVTGCRDTSNAVQVTINPQPASPTATATPSITCIGNSVNLSASASAGYTMNSAGVETFIDIDGTGTSVGAVSDDSEHNITMPSFNFNGVNYTTARVGMNGGIALGSTSGEISFSNAALPATSSAGSVLLLPWWDDLDVQTTPATDVKTETVGSKFIIQYTNTVHNNATTTTVKFQVQLDNSNGKIHFVYDAVNFGDVLYDAGASATVGIQLSSTSALQYSFNTASLTAAQCITFTPSTLNYAWTGPNGFVSALQNPVIPSITSLDSGTYNVVITNPLTGCFTTASTSINVVPAGAVEWIGAVDTDWNNAGNWACGVIPTTTSTVILQAGRPNYPVINLNVEIKKLDARPGSSVTVATGFELKLNGL